LLGDDQSGPLFSDSSRDVTMATNFGQIWQNDLHSKMDISMAVPIQQYWMAIL